MVPIRRSIKYVGITIAFKVRGRGFRETGNGLYQVVVDDTQLSGLSEVLWIGWCSQGGSGLRRRMGDSTRWPWWASYRYGFHPCGSVRVRVNCSRGDKVSSEN